MASTLDELDAVAARVHRDIAQVQDRVRRASAVRASIEPASGFSRSLREELALDAAVQLDSEFGNDVAIFADVDSPAGAALAAPTAAVTWAINRLRPMSRFSSAVSGMFERPLVSIAEALST